MNKKSKIIFILDRAHGVDVDGKESLDGSFKEWKSSDWIVNYLEQELKKLDIPVGLSNPSDKELGFEYRIERANEYAEDYEMAILLSFHHNASPSHMARGNEIFIRRDPMEIEREVANIIGYRLKIDFPQMRYRPMPGLYKQANFNILHGYHGIEPNYNGVLIEFGFMDNEKDLILLKDKSVIKRYCESLLYGMVQIAESYGVGNFLIPEE